MTLTGKLFLRTKMLITPPDLEYVVYSFTPTFIGILYFKLRKIAI